MAVSKSRALRRIHLSQMDERLKPWQGVKGLPRPRDGWIAGIRQALGMRATQLARRLDVTPAAVLQLEDREAAGTITMETLRRAAEALDCTLVYALVPRVTLEHALEARVRKVARQRVQRVGWTMRLEDQEVDPEQAGDQEAALVQELLYERPSAIWDDAGK
jgi:predicted DNA-binding mobile mystery protein A